MHIAFFDYVFERGKPGITGLSANVWEMAGEMAKLGHKVHVVGPYAEGTRGPKHVSLHGFSPPEPFYRNIVGHTLLALQGALLIRRELADVDLVHAPEYLSTAVLTCVSSHPVVLSTPGNIYERRQSGANPFDASATAALMVAARVSARQCARIIAISEDMRDWWERTGATPEKIVVIHHGVDAELFRPDASASRCLGWDQAKHNILFVGRLSREKGVDLLLTAFREIARDHPETKLHIVGDGPLRHVYESMAAHLGIAGSVDFTGWIEKRGLPRYYSAADICVVPSYTEPLGKVVLEALACGTPVLGARVGGIPDIVRPGENGVLFDAGDALALGSALRLVLQEPELLQEMSRHARACVEAHHTWSRVVRRIVEEVYTTVIASQSRA